MAERRTRIRPAVHGAGYNITQSLWHFSGRCLAALKNTAPVPSKSAFFSQSTRRDTNSRAGIQDAFAQQTQTLLRTSTAKAEAGRGTFSFTPYNMAVDPLAQALSGGVRDLAAQALPLLRVHHLKNAPQLFQEVKGPQTAHERRGGRLAVKHAVGVVQTLGAWWRKIKINKDDTRCYTQMLMLVFTIQQYWDILTHFYISTTSLPAIIPSICSRAAANMSLASDIIFSHK